MARVVSLRIVGLVPGGMPQPVYRSAGCLEPGPEVRLGDDTGGRTTDCSSDTVDIKVVRRARRPRSGERLRENELL